MAKLIIRRSNAADGSGLYFCAGAGAAFDVQAFVAWAGIVPTAHQVEGIEARLAALQQGQWLLIAPKELPPGGDTYCILSGAGAELPQ